MLTGRDFIINSFDVLNIEIFTVTGRDFIMNGRGFHDNR